MIAIAAALLLTAAAFPSPPIAAAPATVRICSLHVPGASCAELNAAAIDPTFHPGPASPGLAAFVDPASGALVEPTADQVRELTELRAYEKERSEREAVSVVTLPDGTRRATLGSGFMVDLVVDTTPSAPPAEDAPR